MKSRALPIVLALCTCGLMACEEEQQVRPQSQLQPNHGPHPLLLQVVGPQASTDKMARCAETMQHLGAQLDPAAQVRVTLSLSDAGNHLEVFAAAHGVVLSEPRPPWAMEQLCTDAFWAAEEVIDEEEHAASEMAERPPMPPVPPGVIRNGPPGADNDDDDTAEVDGTSKDAARKAEGAALLRSDWPAWSALQGHGVLGKEAKVAFDKADYKTAASKLREVRAQSPDLLVMFDLALTLDRALDIPGAMRYYQMFLDKSEGKAQAKARASAEAALLQLRKQ